MPMILHLFSLICETILCLDYSYLNFPHLFYLLVASSGILLYKLCSSRAEKTSAKMNVIQFTVKTNSAQDDGVFAHRVCDTVAWATINKSGNLLVHVSKESPSNIFHNPSEVI